MKAPRKPTTTPKAPDGGRVNARAVFSVLPTTSSVVARPVAEGKAVPARRSAHDLGPALPARPGISISQALEEQREDKI